MNSWTPESWQKFKLSQQARYPDETQLESVLSELKLLPPLVSVEEVESLQSKLASAANGETFILQGGDCAELFSDCNADSIASKLKILLQMSLVLIHGLNKPVVKIGRLAGQYAKPRSAETETSNGVSLPCYRGDLINGAPFNFNERTPNPKRLLKGYSFASLTLNYIRTLIENKFADFSDMKNWNLDFISHSPLANEYHQILEKIQKSIDLLGNLSQGHAEPTFKDKLYTCHEALHLQYEQALTREHSDGRWFNLSTHLPWIGMRTAQPDSAHLEYMRGIANPVGVKISANTNSEQLLKLCDKLDPDNTPGRLVLITRFGSQKIEQHLPDLIRAIKKHQRKPLWCCDPMHGNTSITQNGTKTRRFDAIIDELTKAFRIHQDFGTHLGGVHFELTGEHVTECIGGARGLTEFDLQRAYKSLVDPRLNADQSLEMAMRIVKLNQQLAQKGPLQERNNLPA
ncbi:3-deoxy-7-phosphoheptulonate synthase class II [Aliikangiella coralliicola]|uniref:Phospho-2-dehydro-3-deoxyheptonate aldolase n=1 Tax=Aliikangiella coralliicola TaxID=2592383 RepID=A0A545U774_9GAMM|nr:3-deoxy-7-phosphoheptulonate synthase class II [Aliikangiella coralliicola]TQV85329.1 3-deoxy-7-phosphoheptulonate synthase [Aliikangiella coralliicola]